MNFLPWIPVILFGTSTVSLIALLVGAVFDFKVSDEARRTLWGIFWSGIVVGGIILFTWGYRF